MIDVWAKLISKLNKVRKEPNNIDSNSLFNFVLAELIDVRTELISKLNKVRKETTNIDL